MAGKVSGLASARKMAKKGGTATLQIEINSDEEWEALLERKGLIVADVYTEWCGPCVAMMSNLKKIKLEHGSDNLHLATANADQVTHLARFKGKSEPTWVFAAGGQLLRVFFGSNAPALMKLITAEIHKEIKVMEGNAERETVPWDELTEEEKKKNAELQAKRQLELDKIKAEEDLAKERVRRRNLERIARQLTNQTVVLFFPHAITEPEEDGGTKRTCQAAYQLMVKYETASLQIADQLDRFITEEDMKQVESSAGLYGVFSTCGMDQSYARFMEERNGTKQYNISFTRVFYNSDLELPEEVVKEMGERKCLVSLLQEIPVPISPERRQSNSSGASHLPLNHQKMNSIEKTLCSFVYGDSKNPHNPSEDSIAFTFGKEIEGGGKFLACWTPVEYINKTAAMQLLFPHKLAVLDVTLEELPPPSYVIIFEAARAHEVLEVAEPFADDVIHLAFFTTDNPETAEKICHTIHDLEKKGADVVAEAKMVIALKKSNSDPMLTLASLGPLYVSPDLRTGTKEMEMWFPPTIDMTPEPNPWAPPPPPPPKYYRDAEDNVYIEEERSCPDGEVRLCRKLVRTADGSDVEESEWEPVVPPVQAEEPPPPAPAVPPTAKTEEGAGDAEKPDENGQAENESKREGASESQTADESAPEEAA